MVGTLAGSLAHVTCKDFVHVWQGNSQNVGTTGSGSSGAITVSGNIGAPRAYSPNSVPASSSTFSTIQTGALGSITQPTELVSEESFPGVARLSIFLLLKLGTSDSSVLLGGSSGAASTFPPSLSSGNFTDISTIMPPPSTTPADRLGSVLPEPLNTGDALERYQQVAQKLPSLITKDGNDAEIQSVIAEVPEILLRYVSQDEAALAVAQKVFKSLYDKASNSTHVT
ncbi:hypothetical protein ACP4OV_012680 [Aristida adscensionis]